MKSTYNELNDAIGMIDLNVHSLDNADQNHVSAFSRECSRICLAHGWTLDEYDRALEENWARLVDVNVKVIF